MRRWLPVVFAALLTSPYWASPCWASPRPEQVIPLEPYADDHWAFHANVAGQDQLMVFDTGGGITAVTPQAAAALGCQPWGQLTGFRMRGDRVDSPRCESVAIGIGGRRFPLSTVVVWDFNASLPKDVKPIAANVGLDVFEGRVVTLDIADRELILESPASFRARVAGATASPTHVTREMDGYSTTVAVGLDTPKGRVWMHLDSGDDTPITVGHHIAALLGLDPERKGRQPLSLALAGGTPLVGNAYVKDLIFDGNIGAPILSKWVITMDLAHGRVWVAPHGPQPQ